MALAKLTSSFLLVFGNPETREHLKEEMKARFPFSRFAFSHEKLTSFKHAGSGNVDKWDLHKFRDIYTAESFGIFVGKNRVGEDDSEFRFLSIPEGYRLFSVKVKEEIWWGIQAAERALPQIEAIEYSIDLADRKLPSRSYYKLKEMVEAVGVKFKAGEKILEVGCAPGGMSLYGLDQGCKVTGVDRGVVSQTVRQNPDFQQLHYSISDTPDEELPRAFHWLVVDVHAEPRILIQECQFLFSRVSKGIFLTLKLTRTETIRQLPRIHEELKKALPWKETLICQLPSHHQEICFIGIL